MLVRLQGYEEEDKARLVIFNKLIDSGVETSK
jgi:hypothetical protein